MAFAEFLVTPLDHHSGRTSGKKGETPVVSSKGRVTA